MPSQRRVRVALIAIVAIVFLFFYYSGEASKIQNQDFYKTTLKAMRAKEDAKNAKPQQPIIHPGADADTERPAVPVAKGGKSEADSEMEEISIAGRTKMTVPKMKDPNAVQAAVQVEKDEEVVPVVDHTEAKSELNDILKRSPIIIFSKSYCPYSKKAKTILLERYAISPKPFVVELDQHPIGSKLQDLLGQNTGRRTVPNVLVNGKSIGGGDDIAALDHSDELVSTLRTMGGKWVTDVRHLPPPPAAEGQL